MIDFVSQRPPTPIKRGGVRPRKIQITFEVWNVHGPALHSAIEEISNEIGGRLEGPHRFVKEDALTYAAEALGALRAAVNRQFPEGDPDYV